MEFKIFPLRGVDGIKFGMTPEEVRRNFADDPVVFKKALQDDFPCAYFQADGIFFYYDGDGHLEAVEFALPAQPSVENLKLLGLSLGEAIAALSSLDSEVQEEPGGAIAYQLGVSIYSPVAKDKTMTSVESVLAFRPGYFN